MRRVWGAVPPASKLGLMVTSIVICIILLSLWTDTNRTRYNRRVISGLREMMRDASRFSAMAKQDNNPLLSLLHTTQAMSYVRAGKNLVGSADLTKLSGMDIEEMGITLDGQEQHALSEVVHAAPSLMPDGNYMVSTGWLA